MTSLARELDKSEQNGFTSLSKGAEAVARLTRLVSGKRDAVNAETVFARSVASSWHDLLGDYPAAKDLLSIYPETSYVRLKNRGIKLAQLLTQKARVAYRERRLDEAETDIKRAIRASEGDGEEFRESHARFWLAKIQHRKRQFDLAQENATRALSFFAAQKNDYWYGICYLLLGRLAFRKGELGDATRCLLTATRFLGDTGDTIHQASVLDTMGCVLRAGGKYREAQSNFDNALSLYRLSNHLTYEARVRNNLALTLMYLGDYEAALRELEQSRRATPLDARTSIETDLFESRVYFERGPTYRTQSLDLVAAAIANAQESGIASLEIEARVHLARVQIDQNLIEAAREQALLLRQLPMDRKHEVACNLLMSQIHCRQIPADRAAAAFYIEKALQQMRLLENRFLKDWSTSVKDEIANLDDSFRIEATTRNLECRPYLEKLKFWLLRRAIERVKQKYEDKVVKSAITDVLGLGRGTWEKWIRDWENDNNGKRQLLGVETKVLADIIAELNNSSD